MAGPALITHWKDRNETRCCFRDDGDDDDYDSYGDGDGDDDGDGDGDDHDDGHNDEHQSATLLACLATSPAQWVPL